MDTKIRIMYWKEIPLQIECTQGKKRTSSPLGSRFQEAVDAIAMFDGSYGSDAYLDGFEWIEKEPQYGELNDVLEKQLEKINRGMPEDFVSLIRDLIKEKKRLTFPGAIDHWWSN